MESVEKSGFSLIFTVQTVEKSVENVENGLNNAKIKVEKLSDIPPYLLLKVRFYKDDYIVIQTANYTACCKSLPFP